MADQMPWEQNWGAPTTPQGQMPWEQDWGQKATPDPMNAGPSKIGSALTGAGHGLTLGYAPQLQALAEPALAKLYDAIYGTKVSDNMPSYVQRRDENIANEEAMQKANPKSYAAGNLGGNILSGAAVPLAAPEGLLAKSLAGAGSGIAMGGALNPGDTKGVVNPLQIGERAANAGSGALTGAAVPVIGQALAMTAPAIRAAAESNAFRSLGPYARDVIKAMSRDKINPIGATLLDQGIIGGMPKSYEGIENAIGAAKNTTGKALGSEVENLASMPGPSSINRSQVAKGALSRVINPSEDLPGVATKNAKFQDYMNNFASGGDQEIPLLEAEKLKTAAQREVNYNRLPDADIPIEEQATRALSTELKNAAEKEAASRDIAAIAGQPTNFQKLKNAFGNLSTSEDIVGKRNAKEYAKKFSTDMLPALIGAGGGLAGGGDDKIEHMLLGAGAGLALRGNRLYGNQIAATLENNASKALANSPIAAQVLARNPWLIQQINGEKQQ